MNRMARAALFASLLAVGMGGAFSVACRGGGTLDGLDGSFDGQAVQVNATDDPPSSPCAHTLFFSDDEPDDGGCVLRDE